jgi:hypothetical protein
MSHARLCRSPHRCRTTHGVVVVVALCMVGVAWIASDFFGNVVVEGLHLHGSPHVRTCTCVYVHRACISASGRHVRVQEPRCRPRLAPVRAHVRRPRCRWCNVSPRMDRLRSIAVHLRHRAHDGKSTRLCRRFFLRRDLSSAPWKANWCQIV